MCLQKSVQEEEICKNFHYLVVLLVLQYLSGNIGYILAIDIEQHNYNFQRKLFLICKYIFDIRIFTDNIPTVTYVVAVCCMSTFSLHFLWRAS